MIKDKVVIITGASSGIVVGLPGHVQFLINSLSALPRDLVGDPLQPVFAPGAEDDLRALLREQLSGRLADVWSE